ncbi:alpha-mannosidase [Isoptericola cucumis]|uniref:Alpha-mannosidase n=1 Tax=Isoptericola cucumis TaxID=1776856 RepID=A0ABQ2BA81_9MICO|nr:alpha-mannosidase [Isoptericola cucumis]GGI11515.1 alpha-mannosidase [Isoptericola cucumis]
MHTQPQLTLDRLERVLRERIRPHVHERLDGVSLHAWQVDGDGEPVPAAHAIGLAPLPGRETPRYEPFELGSTWGPAWSTTWFRVEGRVPAHAPDVVELCVDLGWEDHSVGGHGEALVHRPDGSLVKALHPRHGWLRLRGPGAPERLLEADGTFTLYVEAAANPLVLGLPPFEVTDVGDKDTAASFAPYVLRTAELAEFRTEVWELVRDLEVVGGLAAEVPTDEPRYWRLLDALERSLDAYDHRDPATAVAARAALADVLSRPAHASAHRVTAVGHAHIDSAWLWPLRETRRKVARTVSNVLALMDGDPDLVYAMSSAQQFAWLQEDQPELFARVLERVREGRFVPVGGMWVESDAVMPTGESIVRQLTYGSRYFAQQLGVVADGMWLPDSFGYSGALPQIARRAGFRWFLTQKISWNDTNTFPHHSFSWEGIDGTRIFTHFPPVDTYAAELSAAELHHASSNFRDKARSSHSLVPFGYGDGGGGPTREMLGRARRFADLEGAPRVEVRGPSEFFAEAEAEYVAAGGPPVWHGELYLELHRGTLTSQLAMKQGNRRAEAMLRTVEHLAAIAALRGADYPRAELDDIWQTVLLHQFHDILPGSSIAWVHREARETYRSLDQRLRALAARVADALGAGGATAPARIAPTAHGTWSVERPAPATPVTVEQGEATVLDNGRLRALVDASGHVVSLHDLAADRELVPAGGRLGALTLFPDVPIRWDAWDVDRHTLRLGSDLAEVESLEASTDDDGAGRVRVVRTRGGSRFTLTYVLRPGSDALDMTCDVDWQEREHLLKVALPLDVRATTARFETQYGYVERPVSSNTSWDEARYEVNQHRYLHVAEPGYGVGVVNDSSHGCDVTRLDDGGTLVRLSLLRAARYPDPGADLGTHRMAWSVVAADQPATVTAAYALNAPVLDAVADVEPLVALDVAEGAAVVDWVKLADDGSGDVVARVAEVAGGRARAALVPGVDLRGATVVETDLHERPVDPAADGLGHATDHPGSPAPADGAALRLGPFQLTTLRIRPGSSTTKE